MLVLRGLIGGFFQLAGIAALLLLPAGTWHWPRAVQFLVVYGVVNSVAIVALARWAPGGLEARLEPPYDESQPVADRVVTALLFVSLLGWLAFVPIDVFHLELLPRPPLAVSIFGAVVGVAGYAIIWTTLFQNSFVVPIVMDQTDRGQVLIDTGPYALVRHPFYLGLLLFHVGLGLWLESYAAVLAVVVPLAALLARIRIEERMLHVSLPGYTDYTQRVRYRLVPFVW